MERKKAKQQTMQISSYIWTTEDRIRMLTQFNSNKEHQNPEEDKIYFEPEDWKEQEAVDKIAIASKKKQESLGESGGLFSLKRRLFHKNT